MRFWVSWWEASEDYRPVTYPPNEAVLGWWCSGYSGDGTATLCAAVEADSLDAAKAAIDRDWPGVKTWRFVEHREPDWKPGDRFPIDGWMTERFARGSNAAS